MSIDRDALDRAIERGLAAVWRAQGEGGAIDGTNHGGPLYAGIALATRAQVGVLDEHDRVDVVRWMRSTQLSDGSYPSSPCAMAGTLDASVATYAGLKAAGVPDDDPAQVRARRFIEDAGGFEKCNPMYFPTLAVAGIIPPEALPTPYLSAQLVPFLQDIMGRRFNQWIGMSADIMPLITRGLLDHGQRASWLSHPLRRFEEERILHFLKNVQNPSGSLSGVLIYTAQLASTFALMEVPRSDPHFASALAALSTFRIPNEVGMEYMPCTAEIWNTAEAVRATMRAGGDPNEPRVRAAVDWLIARQTTIDAPESWQNPRPGAPRQGGWPFEATNVQNPDCDTTGAVLHALGWVLKRGGGPQVRAAIERGIGWLLPMQNDDGGWPSMTRGVGEKPPGPLYAKPFWPPTTLKEMLEVALHPPLELQDPSTAAMTGRIVRALADCGVAKDRPELRAALAFMRAQQWHDRWWGRWEVNYVAGTAFGLIGLAGTDADRRSDWVQRSAAWIESQQNEDGGFGEGTETYRDWRAKGPWPSRADLTGKAIMGLIDAKGATARSVERAVEHLIATQRDDGGWRSDDGEYVILPPDLFYTNPLCNQIDAVEGLVYYREALSERQGITFTTDVMTDGSGAEQRHADSPQARSAVGPRRAVAQRSDPTNWSDEKLDAMRLIGDPRADEVVAELFRTQEVEDVSALFHRLTRDDAPVPIEMPAIVHAYFEETAALPDFADPALIERGEEVFAVHGVSIVSGLFCSALPHAYCAHRGAKVLTETGRMVGDFTRRIVETAQFVMDVMAPGGLGPSGRGLRTTQKVRLIHAAIRHMLTTRRDWPSASLGVPINQEDLAGTLLTFSIVILDALDTMKVELKDEERRAYFHAWRCVGHVIGLRSDMIPTDIDDAYALYAAIQRRQFGPSEDGRVLTRALLDAMKSYVPGTRFDGAGAVYVRHFLGDPLADMLDVPPPDWTELVYRVETLIARVLDHVTERSPLVAHLFGGFDRVLMESLSVAYRGGKGVGFRIPDSLRARWRLE